MIHVYLSSRIFMMIHNENRENSYDDSARARRDEIFRIILIPVETSENQCAYFALFDKIFHHLVVFCRNEKFQILKDENSQVQKDLRRMTHNFILTFTLFFHPHGPGGQFINFISSETSSIIHKIQ